MFGYADESSITYEQRADVLNSVHCKEVTGYSGRADTSPCMNDMGKFIKEKVIRTWDFIYKNGTPARCLYGDRTHLYENRWLASPTSRARRKRKRRKEKVPNSSSSTLLPRGRVAGWVEHEYEDAVTTEYVQRADVHIHTAVFSTPHAGSMNSVRSEEVTGTRVQGEAAPGMEEVHKYFEEKVIMDTGEEIILKYGKPAFHLYGDCTHLNTQPSGIRWLDWMNNRHRHIRRLGCSGGWTGLLLTSSRGQDCQ